MLRTMKQIKQSPSTLKQFLFWISGLWHNDGHAYRSMRSLQSSYFSVHLPCTS